ncbi:MAG: MaoC/PaaZ C-terminal domain-containing protein [Bacteroidia bacterium]
MSKTTNLYFDELQSLKTMVWPAIKTFTRGKSLPEGGINISANFHNVLIEPKQLHAYRNYFGFRSELPITYLYLLTQRAQATIMLTEAYSISMPGTVHLSTNLAFLNEINPNKSLAIESSLSVPYKQKGSLIPEFLISFFQGDELVAKGNGNYFVKRKSAGPKQKKEALKVIENPDFELDWYLDKNVAKDYAEISNDHNPIHKGIIAAKLLGLKSQIAHGWYVASRCAQHVEQQKRRQIGAFGIDFKGMHTLPGNYIFKLNKNHFQTLNNAGDKVLSKGSFNF